MRVLVTGGAGFIGSALVDRLLLDGFEVDVADDLSTGSLGNLARARADRGTRRLSFHRLDLRFPSTAELVVRRKPEVIFHLAAPPDGRPSMARPAVDAEVGILGTIHMLQGALSAGTAKIVFASSGAIYGPPDDVPVREGHPQRPETPAAVVKKSVVDYLHYYRQVHGLEYTALVLADVFGPRQRADSGVVSTVAAKLVAKERPSLPGDGSQTRDFLYVDDAVDAFIRAIDHAGGLSINVGTGVETTLLDLHDAMARMVNITDPPRFAPAAGDPAGNDHLPRFALDPGRAAIHLGWKPETPFDEGLARTVEWHAEEFRTARRAPRATPSR
jgi:UDP-glucose 4-epimerase